jgi:hypothetical protein
MVHLKRAEWEQDGSALTDVLAPNDVCPEITIKDDAQVVRTLEEMMAQDQPTRIEDFRLCPVDELIRWVEDVDYDFQIAISLEMFTPAKISGVNPRLRCD